MDQTSAEWLASVESAIRNGPIGWARIISVRLALRAFPISESVPQDWFEDPIQFPFRALFLSWAAENTSDEAMADAASKAAIYPIDEFGFYSDGHFAARVAAFAASTFVNTTKDELVRIILGLIDDSRVIDDHTSASFGSENEFDVDGIFLEAISSDLNWLVQRGIPLGSRMMTSRSLWSAAEDTRKRLQLAHAGWFKAWSSLASKLQKVDPNYAVWIDWYRRRIMGSDAAFDIPGDFARTEDKAILRRLAEATDEDFWGKGHEFVNAELTRWLEVARARAAVSQSGDPPATPPQDPSATTYGVNQQGQLDRLPPADQVHLRDVPNQRRNYADLRAAVFELLQEGQRLGPRLQPRLERFGQSLPEDFRRAEAYLVWRDGIALRRLYRAHLAVAQSKDPDPARLEPAVAEGLGGVLDLYNPFAFADDGIRAKDEATIAPQERAGAEAEASSAAPLVSAIMAAPEIVTAAALGDLAADADNADLPADDPYAAQALDQANRTWRNLFAAMVSDTWVAFNDTGVIGKGIAGGAAWDGIKLIATTAGGIEFAPLLAFIATNAPALQSYAAIAFTSFPHLPDVIAQISALWQRLRQVAE